jgi:hypothetical protein
MRELYACLVSSSGSGGREAVTTISHQTIRIPLPEFINHSHPLPPPPFLAYIKSFTQISYICPS